MAVTAWTPAETAAKVMNEEKVFILDVRNEDAFQDWKIESEHFEYLNIPYFDMLDGVEDVVEQLPKDKDILVVCAKVGSSEMVADMLSDEGLDVAYLEGGMKAWSEHLEPVKVGDIPGGALYQFLRLGKGCLSYMAVSNGEAVVIDAVRMTDTFEAFAQKQGAVIKHVLDTHLHADHISGGRMLAENTGASYWLPPKDAGEVTFRYEPLEDEQTIAFGETEVAVHAVYSPGHTIGSTSFIMNQQYLFSGDILFVDSIGRPDLAGKAEDWVADLRNTLYQTYASLSKDLIVLPAHFMNMSEIGDDHTVKAELGELFKKNHGLNMEDEEAFRRTVTENLPPQPNSHEEIRQTNMGKITPEEEKQREMEIGPNRCAVQQ
ncbi:MBL fold metallo-hydrolase [Alkalicoccus chagannorensis]|uniref:MBL fold metallo-hydrolase n=1 Tax=Alkalicoccus chagannorensis TaxID=427072 RepID=UPI00040F4EE6|nr:MBL fold metallo-hydrolase [Alkalicoccus chagannorensis]